MPDCTTPLWPCAMTGAAACLAGFEGITVVIHGSSGCYYYPATLLHAPLHGTFILENEVIFGSGDRLREVIGDLSNKGNRIAVVTTCVPSVLGEDIKSLFGENDVIIVDSPGFVGEMETGYHKALSALSPVTDPGRLGINIDGVSLSDPFYEGNIQEISRILRNAMIPIGTIFCRDTSENIGHASPLTVGTNEDFKSGVGEYIGGTLGIPDLRETCKKLAARYTYANMDPVFNEIDKQEERIIHACDKFLRRYDPPGVAIFAGAAYALFAADSLKRYLDAQILIVGTRNDPPVLPNMDYRVEKLTGLEEVRDTITALEPDLVIGSSFERSLSSGRAFLGIIPPLRGQFRLAYPPLVGVGGTLHFIENVLNACIDKRA